MFSYVFVVSQRDLATKRELEKLFSLDFPSLTENSAVSVTKRGGISKKKCAPSTPCDLIPKSKK
jgi:hypothetical protein